jgi:hypothetical protein
MAESLSAPTSPTCRRRGGRILVSRAATNPCPCDCMTRGGGGTSQLFPPDHGRGLGWFALPFPLIWSDLTFLFRKHSHMLRLDHDLVMNFWFLLFNIYVLYIRHVCTNLFWFYGLIHSMEAKWDSVFCFDFDFCRWKRSGIQCMFSLSRCCHLICCMIGGLNLGIIYRLL